MPYSPPAPDAVNFNFTESGYTAPAPDSVNFNFFDAEADNVSRLTAQWAVDAAPLPISILHARWLVDANGMQSGLLSGQWATIIPSSPSSKLYAQWGVEVQPNAQGLITAQWAVVVPQEPLSSLGLRWSVDVGEGIAYLPVRYATLAPSPVDLLLDAQWAVAGTPSEISILDSQWIVEGAPAYNGALLAEWQTLGISDPIDYLDIAWATLTPMDATSILDTQWGHLEYVEQQCVILYYDEIGAGVELYARIGLDDIAEDCVLDSGMLTSVGQSIVLPSALGDVSQSMEIDSPILDTVAQSIEIVSPLLLSVSQDVEIDSSINTLDDIAQAIEVISPILGDSQVIVSTQPALVINGQTVPLASLDISLDEGEYAWTCDATLLDPRQYPLFHADDPFTIDLAGETYSFIVDSKRMARSLSDDGINFGASIAGISPSAVWAMPRVKRVTKTWSTAVVASSIGAELLPGGAIDWRIIDWSIPALRLAADNEAPIDVLRRVAAAAGGLVESEPDGSIYVRYAYPAPVADYESETPEQEYSDIADRFAVSEGFSPIDIVNKLRILDVTPGAYSDVLEFEVDRMDATQGKLRVYPSPWRETFELEHTSLPIVSIERIGIETAEHTETVEVLAGEGSVQYPIYQLVSVEWLYVDLGGVTFEQDQRDFKSTSTTKTESLARITYRTRFVDHRAVAYQGASVQFIVREPELV